MDSLISNKQSSRILYFQIFDPPQITVHLQKPVDLTEGDSTHLEARFTPIDDPSLKVEWFRDAKPLFHANRYKMVQDFGFAILDILHLFAQVLFSGVFSSPSSKNIDI